MAALMALVAALAAQAAQSTTSAPPAVVPETANMRQVGQRTYVDLEGGAGYSTNPQFSFSSDEGSANGLRFAPRGSRSSYGQDDDPPFGLCPGDSVHATLRVQRVPFP